MKPGYGSFWKKAFDYKSKAESEEFGKGLTIMFVLGGITLVGFIISALIGNGRLMAFRGSVGFKMIVALLAIATLLHLIPFLALTVRRLHTVEKSAWWSLLIPLIGVGWILLANVCLTGKFNPMNNIAVAVYGPPPFEEYDPSLNKPVEVYGPPEFFEEEFDPTINEEPCVYGPPEFFGFEPDDNIQPEVYGPPEMFDKEAEENE